MHEDQTRVTITLKDGRTFEKFVEHAIGSLERPMSDADLEAKFRGLAKGILSAEETDRLIGLCWKIQSLADASEIARASVSAQSSSPR
jgi:2-methylcitrate dehydratase PrpD